MNESDLAVVLKRYWIERGYAVGASVREVAAVNRAGAVYRYSAMRSTLLNGLPPDYRGELACPLTLRRRSA